ncbi:paralemmin 1a isoform X2 [Embiotoca jacksoni]|uniref:paralemmin 1a isoform X2 n=1 Tax=Embiotoca jacksoni TaxID=100190 RepID=UPI003703ABF0
MMEISEVFCQQDRLQLIAEKRKWQTEVENKKRQLEDDRRALQHHKSKALRERWLLDGAPSAGPEQDEVRRQLEEDEEKTRSLEETITRLEQELVSLETGAVCQTVTHTTETSGSLTDVEIKGQSSRQEDRDTASGQVIQALAEVQIHKSPGMKNPREVTEEMKRAMYSVEIKVERDRVTGETRVLSTNTTLPVDLSLQGVKVYEDERKVVHEMNGEDGIHLLSSSEVEELLHKADEASMMSQTVTTATAIPTAAAPEEEVGPEEEAGLEEEAGSKPSPQVAAEITGLEAEPGSEPSVDGVSVGGASAENPVTMVFMGYQSVEDEDETKRVLGLQGTVKAELVLINGADGKTSPGGDKQTDPPTSTKPPMAATASNGETAGEGEVKKEKQPCKCCSIM